MLDPKEERRYGRLRKLASELHTPLPEAFWELEVRDRAGEIIQRHRQRSHSWNRNAYNHLFCEMASKNASDSTFGAGKLSARDYGGTVRYNVKGFCHSPSLNLDIVHSTHGILTTIGMYLKGIIVGSGENAESFEGYALQTRIVDGTGAGELNYVASEDHAITYTDTTLADAQIRYFNNNSGGSIAVNEVGLVDGLYIINYVRYILVSRDKLGSTVSVPDTGQLKVTYTIQLTYPA